MKKYHIYPIMSTNIVSFHIIHHIIFMIYIAPQNVACHIGHHGTRMRLYRVTCVKHYEINNMKTVCPLAHVASSPILTVKLQYHTCLHSYHIPISTITIDDIRFMIWNMNMATGEFPAQRPVTRSFDVFFDLRWLNGWVNNGKAGDLRRHGAHYDVAVMKIGQSHESTTTNKIKNREQCENFLGCYFSLYIHH